MQAVICQDIACLDSFTPGSVATSTSNDTNIIQDGLAEKLGIFIQGLSNLATSFVIAFSQSWKLTLAISTCVFAVLAANILTLT